MTSPFPCSPVIRECSWKKTPDRKKKKKKSLKNYKLYVKMQPISAFFDIIKLADLCKKMLMTGELEGSRDLYIFWIFFGWGIIAPSFIIVGYV